jgi:uncharacterized protein YcgI (DUF1989 family)
VADVNFWNLHNPAERFYSSKTRQLHASHLTTHDRWGLAGCCWHEAAECGVHCM